MDLHQFCRTGMFDTFVILGARRKLGGIVKYGEGRRPRCSMVYSRCYLFKTIFFKCFCSKVCVHVIYFCAISG